MTTTLERPTSDRRTDAEAALDLSEPLAPRDRMPTRRPGRNVVLALILALGTALLTPVFATNALGTADQTFFTNWDHFSEALVLAKIETTTPAARVQVDEQDGLFLAEPNPIGPYDTFDQIRHGVKSNSTGYAPYIPQLGLQGFFFTAVYHAGCSTSGCLETVSGGMTAAALIGFALMLMLIAPRSVGIVFLVCSVASPWIVASARNLYWVPWSWFLPAIAAIAFVIAPTRRRRWLAFAAMCVFFVLRFGMGFEYLTSIALLATGVPMIAWVFGRSRASTWRGALRESALIFGASVGVFALVLFLTCLSSGRGDLAWGFQNVLQHALVRTYGGSSTDPVTALSLAISPWTVVYIYVFNWATPVFTLGWGAPFTIAFGSQTVFVLLAACAVIIAVRFTKGDRRWRRDAMLVVVAIAPVMSWVVLAKAHSFVHQPMNFVLWYLLGLALLVWVALSALGEVSAAAAKGAVGRVRRVALQSQ